MLRESPEKGAMMVADFPLMACQASIVAKEVDKLYVFLIILCGASRS